MKESYFSTDLLVGQVICVKARLTPGEEIKISEATEMVNKLNFAYCYISNFNRLEYQAFMNRNTGRIIEWLVIYYKGNGYAPADVTACSYASIAKTAASMLCGGCYAQIDHYQEIMNDDEYIRIEVR